MASNASSLYGISRPKSTKSKEVSSSTNAAFASQLSSLLAQPPSTSSTSTARTRPSKAKSSIFTTHNRNTKKRALADISQDDSSLSQKHSASLSDAIDPSALHRSKQKLEEKARLYSSMKRGTYIPPSCSSAQKLETNLLVDFDRKWAEDIEAGRPTEEDSSSDSDPAAEELVDYEDEFGRTRRGTRTEADRERRRLAAQNHAVSELAQLSARPTAPPALIHGDVIQAAAFNPDTNISEQMDELARKRDRSMTPPPAVHYDATSEVRSKGVGFYAFSRDEEARQREMEGLEGMREGTERERKEREERERRRKEGLEERKRVIRVKREEKLAEAFLDGLDGG